MQRQDLDAVLVQEKLAYAFPWTHELFADCLRQSHYYCSVGWQGEVLVSHAVLSVAAGEAHLLNVCVARSVQGRGYGRQTMHYVIDQATQLGANALFLEVRVSNVMARGLYRSLGFNEIGLRREYYPADRGREDAEVMGMELFRS